jgi:hypothetical protein
MRFYTASLISEETSFLHVLHISSPLISYSKVKVKE